MGYYTLLHRDLGQTVQELDYYIGYEAERAAAADRAYDALSGGPELPPEDLSIAVSVATQRRTLRLYQSTFTDLTSTGNLLLLQNRELRDQILGFYESAERDFAVIERNTIYYLDRLWSLDRSSEEVAAVRSAMWLRSEGFTGEATRVRQEAIDLRAAIEVELESRWGAGALAN